MYENNNATFYGNSLCAVDDDLLLLPVLSVILNMYGIITVVYVQRSPFSISNIQKYHVCEVYFTSVLHERTMSAIFGSRNTQ